MCDREAATMRGCHLGYTDTLKSVYSGFVLYRSNKSGVIYK